jgi:hypothetical protein
MAGRAPVGAPLLFSLLYLILRRAVWTPAVVVAEIGRDRRLLRQSSDVANFPWQHAPVCGCEKIAVKSLKI